MLKKKKSSLTKDETKVRNPPISSLIMIIKESSPASKKVFAYPSATIGYISFYFKSTSYSVRDFDAAEPGMPLHLFPISRISLF